MSFVPNGLSYPIIIPMDLVRSLVSQQQQQHQNPPTNEDILRKENDTLKSENEALKRELLLLRQQQQQQQQQLFLLPQQTAQQLTSGMANIPQLVFLPPQQQEQQEQQQQQSASIQPGAVSSSLPTAPIRPQPEIQIVHTSKRTFATQTTPSASATEQQQQANSLGQRPFSERKNKLVYFDAQKQTKYRQREQIYNDLHYVNKMCLYQKGLCLRSVVITERIPPPPSSAVAGDELTPPPSSSSSSSSAEKSRRARNEAHAFELHIEPLTSGAEHAEDERNFQKICLLKETANISDRVFQQMRSIFKHRFPTKYKQQSHNASILHRFPTRRNDYGVYNDVRRKIETMARLFRDQLRLDDDGDNNRLRIKLSLDGSQCGRKLKFLNFTFSFLQQIDQVTGCPIDANYTLGIFECAKESYELVKSCIHDALVELEAIKTVKLSATDDDQDNEDVSEKEDDEEQNSAKKKAKKRELEVEYYVGADLKCLAILMGCNAANSSHPCPWCRCPKKDFARLDAQWSIVDEERGARSLAHVMNNNTNNTNTNTNNSRKRKAGALDPTCGQINEPIFKFIPLHNFVPDLLHCNLRISEVLFDLLLAELRQVDEACADAKQRKLKPLQTKFFDYIAKELRISNPTYTKEDQKDKRVYLKTFGRDQNLVILSQVPIVELFGARGEVKQAARVQQLWRSFYRINMSMIEHKWQPAQIKTHCDAWLSLYVSVYAESSITLYMHILQQHLHQFAELHGNVNLFNCQRLEKSNHMNTVAYYQGTNKHKDASGKDDFLVQMINKKNRIEYLLRYQDQNLSKKRQINSRLKNLTHDTQHDDEDEQEEQFELESAKEMPTETGHESPPLTPSSQ